MISYLKANSRGDSIIIITRPAEFMFRISQWRSSIKFSLYHRFWIHRRILPQQQTMKSASGEVPYKKNRAICAFISRNIAQLYTIVFVNNAQIARFFLSYSKQTEIIFHSNLWVIYEYLMSIYEYFMSIHCKYYLCYRIVYCMSTVSIICPQMSTRVPRNSLWY